MKRLSDIPLVPEVERLSTGVMGLDECLAEDDDSLKGIPLSASILLSGMPGGGKSSLALCMAAAAKKAGEACDVLILSGEEPLPRLRKRWERLNLSGTDPFILELKEVEDALQAMEKLRPVLTIVDSIQMVEFEGSTNPEVQLLSAKLLSLKAQAVGSTILFISHVTKDGTSHSGKNSLSHLVDIHMHVTVNAKKAERYLEMRKNRMGRAGFQVQLNVTKNVISCGAPQPIGNGMAGMRTQLEKAKEKAMTLLMEGRKLSGYDFDEAGVSGNLWRAALEMAAKQLAKDGFEVEKGKINGRGHTWLTNPPPKEEPAETGGVVVGSDRPIEMT